MMRITVEMLLDMEQLLEALQKKEELEELYSRKGMTVTSTLTIGDAAKSNICLRVEGRQTKERTGKVG